MNCRNIYIMLNQRFNSIIPLSKMQHSDPQVSDSENNYKSLEKIDCKILKDIDQSSTESSLTEESSQQTNDNSTQNSSSSSNPQSPEPSSDEKSFFADFTVEEIFSHWHSSNTLLEIAKKLGFTGESLARIDYEYIESIKTREVWRNFVISKKRQQEKTRDSYIFKFIS
uniref:HNH homing endonuclease n=1 Tax=Stauridium tetras TaxID=271398 RepID=E2QAR7_9CHLO|nr:HNH homing endonuclease [Stauridium tetras]